MARRFASGTTSLESPARFIRSIRLSKPVSGGCQLVAVCGLENTHCSTLMRPIRNPASHRVR